ncbi:MAG: Maf family protein [Desulfitobacteriia bacterium]|jgi:septum formation protein
MLVLASSSPRRSELLREWGYEFSLVSAPVSEELDEEILPEEAVQDLARRKALAGYQVRQKQKGIGRDLILGADTIVVLKDRILGKPRDAEDAEQMLKSLSGKTHQVMTAIALAKGETEKDLNIETAVDITAVTFRDLSLREIRDYIATGEPMDKAAAYAIQGKAGDFAVSIKGSLTNVIGLPMELLTAKLKERGVFPAPQKD